MHRLLAIETSGPGGTVALALGDSVLEREVAATREQTGQLLPMIDGLLKEAGVEISQLDAIAFGQGPGSFTGLRVAAAVTQGLALASGVPVVAVPSMAGLAQGGWRESASTAAVVCIDARMGEVYWGHYQIVDGLARGLTPDAIGLPDAVAGLAGMQYAAIGDGFTAYREELAEVRAGAIVVLEHARPRATDLVPLAGALARAGETVPPEAALPLYLRDSTAWAR